MVRIENRTDEETAGCFMIFLGLLTVLCVYVAYRHSDIGGKIAFGLLSAVTGWLYFYSAYRIAFPIVYRIDILSDRVNFSDSSKPNQPLVLEKQHVVRFFWKSVKYRTQNSWLAYETLTANIGYIGREYVATSSCADEFFEAVLSEWGPGFVPE